MSNTNTGAPAWEPSTPNEDSGRLDAAREQAAGLGDQAAESTHKVAGTARDEAGSVLRESKSQARELIDQARTELGEQAAQQQSRAADGLRSLSDELKEMAAAGPGSGLASELVGQASERTSTIAEWLGARDPGSLVDELRSFAGRRPVTFLAVAAAAGVLAGRFATSVGGAPASPRPEPGAHAAPPIGTPIYSSVADSFPTSVPPAPAGEWTTSVTEERVAGFGNPNLGSQP